MRSLPTPLPSQIPLAPRPAPLTPILGMLWASGRSWWARGGRVCGPLRGAVVPGVEVVEGSAVDGAGLLLLLAHGSGCWVHSGEVIGPSVVDARGADVAGVVGEAHTWAGVEAVGARLGD